VIELQRAEPPEDRADRIRAAVERTRGREQLPGDEYAARTSLLSFTS
jgi:hypothetical protein